MLVYINLKLSIEKFEFLFQAAPNMQKYIYSLDF